MKNKGFTLLELLITVSMISILLTIAYPNYINFMRETYRNLAQNDMLTMAYRLEKVKTKSFSYKTALDEDGVLKTNIYRSYSPDISNKRYDFTYEFNDNDYKIIATPTNLQGSDTGKFYLSFNGKKYDKKWDKDNDDSYSESW